MILSFQFLHNNIHVFSEWNNISCTVYFDSILLSVTLSKCFTKSNSTKPLKPYFCWTLLYFCCIFDETENCQHIELHVISSYIESRVNEMENNLCKLYCINLKKMIENLLKYYISYVRGKIKEYRFLKKSIIYPVSSIVFITFLCQF